MARSRLTYVALLLVPVLVFVYAGCKPQPVDVGEEYPQRELKLALPADLITGDPANAVGTPNHHVLQWVYNRLVQYNPYTGEFEPDAAESWEVNEDATVFTFHLRKGVQFHKGYGEMTAKDVKFSFERHLDPQVKSRYLTDFSEVARIETPDDYTVRVVLKRPWVGFLGQVIAWRPGSIVKEQAIKDAGDRYPFQPVGTGPYVFVEHKPREYMTLVAHEDYFKGKPRIPSIKAVIVPEETVSVMMLERGLIDMMIPRSGESYRTLFGLPTVNLVSTPCFGWHCLYLNCSRPPLDDVKVRQAIQYAIDQKAIAERVYSGLAAAPVWTVLPAGLFGSSDDVAQYPYNPDKARQLLAQSSYKGQELEIIYIAAYRMCSIAVGAMLEEVGIKVKMTELEAGPYYARTEVGDYDIQRQGLTRLEPDQIVMTFFHSKNIPPAGVNYSFYSNPEVDRLLDLQMAQGVPAERAATLARIQRIISEEVPVALMYIPVYNTATVADLHGDVENFTFWDIRPEYMWFGPPKK